MWRHKAFKDEQKLCKALRFMALQPAGRQAAGGGRPSPLGPQPLALLSTAE